MAGGIGNFISSAGSIFGRSNANIGNNAPPGPNNGNQGTGYQNGQSQLAQPVNNNAAIQSGNTGAADPNNNNPANNADPNKGTQGSQLDNFKDLFTLPTDDKGQPIAPPSDPLSTPIMQLDPAKLQAAAKTVNFAAGLTTEQLQNAMRDPQALMEMMNHVGQQAFAQAITVTSGMAEKAIQTNNTRFEQALPDRIRTTQIKQATAKNPVLQHPAVAPVLEGIRMSIASKNPHLHPDRVGEMAENYFLAMNSDMNQATQQQTQAATQAKSDGPNWAALLEIPANN